MLPDDLSKLRVVDLKAELTQRNLPTKGKKDELIARLQQWLSENKEENATANEQPSQEQQQQQQQQQQTIEANGQQEQATEKEVSHTVPQQGSIAPPPPPPVDEEPESVTEPASEPKPVEQLESMNAETQPATEIPAETAKPMEESKPEEEEEAKPVEEVKSLEESKAVAEEEPMEEDKPVVAAAPVEEKKSEKRPVPAEEEGSDIKGAKRKRLEPEVEKSTEKRSKASTEETTDTEVAAQQQQESGVVSSSAIYIKGFVRPLIVRHVQELISQYGTVKRFWMDAIKTHCYVIYETEKEAKDAFAGIDGIVFPRDTGRKVQVGGLTPEQAEALIGQEQTAASKGIKLDWEKAIDAVCRGESLESSPAPADPAEARRNRLSGIGQITRELQKAATASVLAPGSALPEERSVHYAQVDSSSKRLEQQPEPSASAAPTASLDELFRKTTALPALYYLPVAEEVAKRRLQK